MILVKIDTRKLDKSLNNISESLQDIPKQRNMANIARASSVIASKKFIKDLNNYSKSNKKNMHHIYEWNRVGLDSARLFKLKRNSVVDNRAIIDIVLKKSKTRAPISKVLLKPGKTGKYVKRSGIFKDKAAVMEAGKSVSFIATRNIAFAPSGKIIFRPRGTLITIRNPGGRLTTRSLEKYSIKWQNSMLSKSVESSKIFYKIEKDIARTMSKNTFTSSEVSACIKNICDKFDSGEREF